MVRIGVTAHDAGIDFRTELNRSLRLAPEWGGDAVTGAVVENVDNTIRKVEVIAAYQMRLAKNTLAHVYGSATNPKNICFVEYKHKVLRAKVVKQESHTKVANAGGL